MTTIAWDGETLAADGQVTSSFIGQNDSKKIFTKGGKVFAFCGTYSEGYGFLKRGQPIECDTIVLEFGDKSGIAIYHEKNGSHPIKAPYAIGSGCDFAMGAMLAGCNAVDAVKIAAKLDPYTGGRINSKKIK